MTDYIERIKHIKRILPLPNGEQNGDTTEGQNGQEEVCTKAAICSEEYAFD